MIVLVHGNRETPAIWDLLAARLEDLGHAAPLRLSPPGFGAPVPPGFGGGVLDYREWRLTELRSIDEPIDLVGHDWGGGHVMNAVMAEPELVRSWAVDSIGLFHEDYVWHDLARIWQTPSEGDRWLADFAATPASERAERFTASGVDPAIALRVAEGFDQAMATSISTLYRSARQPTMSQLGASLPAAARRPGLAVRAAEDHLVGSPATIAEAASLAGAGVAVLEGHGHWWMAQNDGEPAARLLHEFWASHAA